MGGILLLFAYLLCGVVAARQLFSSRSSLVQLWIGLCGGLMLLMWLPALYAFFIGFTQAANLLGLGTAALLAAAAVLFRRRRGRLPGRFCGDLPPALFIALVVPLTLLSGYLMYTHTLRPVDGTLHVGQSTYGDLCLHLGIATSLRNAPFPPDYSILPGALLGYPFLADSMVTSMLLFGGDLALSFALTGTLMMALVYAGFVLFAWELTHRKSAVAIAFVLMFLNGGLGFLYTFDGVLKDSTALREVFTGFYKTPTNMVDHNLRWVNVICDMMIPQRTLLAGWMALLPALYMLVVAMRRPAPHRFIALGVWAGLMPMIHTHSFFALGLLSAGCMLYRLFRSKRRAVKSVFICYCAYAAVALALALPQLLTWTFPQTIDGGSLALRFNWVNNQGDGQLIDGYFWFWIKNVGIAYLCMLPAFLTAKPDSHLRAIGCGALIIYAVAETIQFQPNPYDNNKLFYVAYMVMLPSVALYLLHLWEQLRAVRGRAMMAVLLLIFCTASGALSIAREVVSDYQLFGQSEVQAARYIEESLPADAVFLTGDQHNNAVAALTGRDIICGTGSYLYYHGIDYGAQRLDEQRMLEQPAQSQSLFDAYGVDYIYISNYERANFSVDEAWFEANCALCFSDGDVRIYARAKAEM